MCTTSIAVLLMYSNNCQAHLFNSWVDQRSLELLSLVKGCSVVSSIPCLLCVCPVLDVSQVKATKCAHSRTVFILLLAVCQNLYLQSFQGFYSPNSTLNTAFTHEYSIGTAEAPVNSDGT